MSKNRHKSMKAFGEALAEANAQLVVLNQPEDIPPFESKYISIGEGPLRATGIDIFQMNLGKMCNQVCKHCHVDAGPDRKEIMTKEIMEHCLRILAEGDIQTVDLTGGAPEMNPNFLWFVAEAKKLGKHVMVRSNLTILTESGYRDYPRFFAEHQVEVISSLPYYTESNTDKQRGEGVFGKSIEAMKTLNALGYGKPGSGLILNLVYNPVGAFLPPKQEALEKDYKRELLRKFDVEFNSLYTITNMPISRFLDYLIESDNYLGYMHKLVQQFNPSAALGVMCRNTISIGWDGYLYDCDFNQMLELKVNHGLPNHVSAFSLEALKRREIVTARHCYGCTAGSGSSCGGAVV